ncbi:MAG: RusA family crossover junction endodeoxyribonuclease [Gammaproteobacteria bacterium]
MLKIPYPPSTNTLFTNRHGGRAKTKRYAEWSKRAGWEIKTQKPPKIEGPFSLDIIVDRPDKRKRDISNLIKAIEDTLQDVGVIEDDCLCQELTIRWRERESGPLINIHATDQP